MSNDSIEERLSKLEARQGFHDQAIVDQNTNIKEIKDLMGDIKTSLAVLTKSQDRTETTPSLEPRVRLLEDSLNRALGGLKMGRLIAGGIGGLLGAILTIFTKTHVNFN